jgi:alpha-ketoglutarate-dependent taurine dioxygenase
MSNQDNSMLPLKGRRKALRYSSDALTNVEPLPPGRSGPLIIRPAVSNLNLISWLGENKAYIEGQLLIYGAVLFRDFAITKVSEFEHLVNAMAGEPMEYRERSSPRTRVGDRVYTSTDYPASQSIFPHNEHSYSQVFPLKLFFYCHRQATLGGETPLVDTRKVFQRIEARIRERFKDRKWMYVRNYNQGVGLPWQTVFQTNDPNDVERYCREVGIECQWKENGLLRTRQVRSAMARHPRSGEMVWFNHLTFFNFSTLDRELKEAMSNGFSESELPNNTYYGDGEPIEPEVLDHIRLAYQEEMVTIPWKENDLLVLDNMLVAHARRPFEGPRKVLFAMAEPWSWENLSSE